MLQWKYCMDTVTWTFLIQWEKNNPNHLNGSWCRYTVAPFSQGLQVYHTLWENIRQSRCHQQPYKKTRTYRHTRTQDSFSHAGLKKNTTEIRFKSKYSIPCKGRERCHQIHCRMSHLLAGSGDSGRKSRWLPPLLWNLPLSLKPQVDNSTHTPREQLKSKQ